MSNELRPIGWGVPPLSPAGGVCVGLPGMNELLACYSFTSSIHSAFGIFYPTILSTSSSQLSDLRLPYLH